jgi:hypothetical protein
VFDILPVSIRNFVDAIFSPPLTFLELCRDMLANAGTVVGRGISLGNYFGFFGYLPSEWQGVVQSALGSVALLAVLFLVRALWDMYLKVKVSSKWW